MRSNHFLTLAQVCKSRAAQLCIRSAKPACSQALASTVWKYQKANATITKIQLWGNKIGDGGAIALAESLKVTLLMSFRLVRTTPFDVPSANERRSVICCTSVLECCSVRLMRCDVCELCGWRQVRPGVRFSRHECVHLRRFMRLKPSNISINGADVDAEQCLACAMRAINMFLT